MRSTIINQGSYLTYHFGRHFFLKNIMNISPSVSLEVFCPTNFNGYMIKVTQVIEITVE